MRCNQRFFGQECFEVGTEERAFCSRLTALKPAMSQYGFALRDRLPELPSDAGGFVQVKYDGMLSIIMWDTARDGLVAWNPRGRCYYSLGHAKKHPVTEYFNKSNNRLQNLVFIGETYVVRSVHGKNYMTEFNESMSIIKNPRSMRDVSRIRFSVFDYARRADDGGFEKPTQRYIDRFQRLQHDFKFSEGCDRGVVHLPDWLNAKDTFHDSHSEIQASS